MTICSDAPDGLCLYSLDTQGLIEIRPLLTRFGLPQVSRESRSVKGSRSVQAKDDVDIDMTGDGVPVDETEGSLFMSTLHGEVVIYHIQGVTLYRVCPWLCGATNRVIWDRVLSFGDLHRVSDEPRTLKEFPGVPVNVFSALVAAQDLVDDLKATEDRSTEPDADSAGAVLSYRLALLSHCIQGLAAARGDAQWNSDLQRSVVSLSRWVVGTSVVNSTALVSTAEDLVSLANILHKHSQGVLATQMLRSVSACPVYLSLSDQRARDAFTQAIGTFTAQDSGTSQTDRGRERERERKPQPGESRRIWVSVRDSPREDVPQFQVPVPPDADAEGLLARVWAMRNDPEVSLGPVWTERAVLSGRVFGLFSNIVNKVNPTQQLSAVNTRQGYRPGTRTCPFVVVPYSPKTIRYSVHVGTELMGHVRLSVLPSTLLGDTLETLVQKRMEDIRMISKYPNLPEHVVRSASLYEQAELKGGLTPITKQITIWDCMAPDQVGFSGGEGARKDLVLRLDVTGIER
ncbi:hypothetical protein KIPB_002924 [Kipferlia bialata]|uniref:Uncharacterized protein n=1 Tax=Kipferlia bialata TaxID=797122 RepID=A0A9K3CRN9_9EUKA|nr:hypothetical protein KIPB_002924 [Kipferlia bialata]|eukprot:g2924.t1